MDKLYVTDSCGVRRAAIEVNCTQCNVKFLKQIKTLRNNKTSNYFCTRECAKNFKQRTNEIITCAWCEKQVERKASSLRKSQSGLRFCSTICKNHAQSLKGLSALTPDHYGTGKKNHCAVCNAPTEGLKRCKIHRKLYTYEKYITGWKNGEFSGNTCNDECLSSHIRRYMFEKYDSRCQKCGWKQVHPNTGKIPLTINHIDGDCTNSKEKNLELLCPNCHSLTPNYGALNKGSGRKLRKRE